MNSLPVEVHKADASDVSHALSGEHRSALAYVLPPLRHLSRAAVPPAPNVPIVSDEAVVHAAVAVDIYPPQNVSRLPGIFAVTRVASKGGGLGPPKRTCFRLYPNVTPLIYSSG